MDVVAQRNLFRQPEVRCESIPRLKVDVVLNAEQLSLTGHGFPVFIGYCYAVIVVMIIY